MPFQIPKNPAGRHVVEQLGAYLDYELPEAERAAVREHLHRCPQCENELATLRATKQLLRDLPAPAPARSFILSADQAAALRAPHSAGSTRRAAWARLPRLVLGLRLAASAALVLFLVLFSADLLGSASELKMPAASFTVQSGSRLPAAAGGTAAPAAPPQPALAAATSSPALAAASTTAMAAPGGAAAVNTTAPAVAASAATATTAPAVAAAAVAEAPTGHAEEGVAEPTEAAPPVARSAAPTAAAASDSAAPLPTLPAPAPAPVYVPPVMKSPAGTSAGATADQAPIPAVTPAPPPALGPQPAAAPSAPTLRWLPWEAGLGLLAVLLVAASIFLPRQDP